MSTDIEPDDWERLTPWWSAYTESRSISRRPVVSTGFGMEGLANCWDELDPWWDEYAETGHETAERITNLLQRSAEGWTNSASPFDTDPLAADLASERGLRGPLQPRNEVEWSRWLAQLLRPSAALMAEIFDVPVDDPPREIIREDRLSKPDGSFRRPDILVCYEERGISIEVKIDDENYQKTPETAKLVEKHYREREWTHTLLLPKAQKHRLDSLAAPSLDSQPGEQPQIEWDDPGPADVIYWRDVTAAIRSLLLRGAVVDDHWAANAYLFCAVAEQQLMDFRPQPVVKQLASPVSVVDAIRPIRIAETLEEELTYLRARVDA